jgi:WhiB family redox-sensing transcriptional regulator
MTWVRWSYSQPPERRRDIDWMDQAKCKGVSLEVFYPAVGKSSVTAKAWCKACEVRQECLAWALDTDQDGIWGGHTQAERERLREAGQP